MKLFQVLLLITGVLLIIPFLLITAFMNPFFDDYCFAVSAMHRGVLGAAYDWYMTWTGRYFSNILLSIHPLSIHSLALYKISAAIIIIGFWYSMIVFLKRFFRKSADDFNTAIVATFLFFVYLAFMPGLDQGFYWHISSVTYQVPLFMGMLFFVFYDKFKTEGKLKKPWPAALLIFLIAGAVGSNETTLLMFNVFLGCYALFRVWEERSIKIYSVYYLAVSIILSLLSILAPGNFVRAEKSNTGMGYSLGESLSLGFYDMLGKLSEWMLSTPSLIMLIAIFLFLCRSDHLRRFSYTYKVHPLVTGMIFLLVIYCSFFPSYYTQNVEFVQTRILNPGFFFFVLAFFFFPYHIVVYFNLDKLPAFKSGKALLNITAIFAFLFLFGLRVGSPVNNFSRTMKDLESGTAADFDIEMHRRFYHLQNSEDQHIIFPPVKNRPIIFINDLEISEEGNTCLGDLFENKKVSLQ